MSSSDNRFSAIFTIRSVRPSTLKRPCGNRRPRSPSKIQPRENPKGERTRRRLFLGLLTETVTPVRGVHNAFAA